MPESPTWIEERIDPVHDNKLTQAHVVETMLDAERPFFSARQVQARVKPDVSKATVRNRLDELRELDVVAAETYPESITLYYVDHPGSNWPLSPEGKRALHHENPLDRLSLRGFLTLRDSAGIRTLVLAGFQLSLLLFVLGIGMAVAGVGAPVQTDHDVVTAAFTLFGVCLVVYGAERIASRLRSRNRSQPPARNRPDTKRP